MEWWMWAILIFGGFGIFGLISDYIETKSHLIERAETAKREAIASKEKAISDKERAIADKVTEKKNIAAKKLREVERDILLLEKLDEKANQSIESLNLKGNNKARGWYASLYSEVQYLLDDYKSKKLAQKKRPAKKAADQVRETNKEKRELNQKLKFIEYQLKTYEQYFPIIEDFKEYIFEDDRFLISSDGDLVNDEEVDPAKRYLTPEEYEKLTTDERNQLALDKYLNRTHSKLEIGRFYERYIGHLYEIDDWDVKYFGIVEGFDDLGRDLICKKGNQTHIVQTKNWAAHKEIREKYIYQHFATTTHYQLTHEIKKNEKVKPVFISTVKYSDMAKKVAKALKVDLQIIKLKKRLSND